MQESRLFRIVYYLLDKGKSTAPELAEKFEVSVRTIYRDIDIISSMGIPVYATQGKGGGITLLDNFVLNKSLLSTREKEQILMALQGMMAAGQNTSDELLTKLGSLFQSKTTNWIEVDFSNWVKNNPGQDTFNLIKSAIFSRNVISFQYFGSNRERTKRRVEPLRLVFKSKDWYLYGFCLMRSDYRFFKLTRIRDMEIQAEVYSREIPSTYSVGKSMDIKNTIAVKLKFDKKMAFRVYDEFAKEELEYTIMIRQPDFVSPDMVAAALEIVKKKKPNPLYGEIRFDTMQDGKCIEILHIGAFDDEPASFEKMARFAEKNGLKRSESHHREIYLNNANRVEKSKLKTILRFSVE